MNKKLCMAGAGMFSLAMLACSESVESPIAGTAEEPNVFTADRLSSSSSLVEMSSSLTDTPNSSAELPEYSSSSETPEQSSSSSNPSGIYSSAYVPPVLCKTSGGSGCAIVYEGDLWSRYYETENVFTSKYAEDLTLFGEDEGKWFLETDAVDGGKSTIEWAVPVGNDWDSTSVMPVIDACDGFCGSFELNKGTLTYNPFVDVGFNVAGFDSDGTALSVDVSNWTGICIAYLTTVGGTLMLDVGDSLNQVLKYDLPFVFLSKSSTGTNKCFEWSKFKRAGWGAPVEGWEDDVVGEMAARHLSKVYIRFQAQDGTKGQFKIYAVGSNRD